MGKRLIRLPGFWAMLVITIACVLSYVPLITRQGFYNDDWYLIYGAISQGAEKFTSIFASDRPMRAYHMAFMWNIFGANVIWYHVSAIALRIAGGMGLFWIMRAVWKNAPKTAILAALLLVVYPGFLEMPNAIDYQSHILAFTLAVFSILFTVKAILGSKTWQRIVYIFLSIALQIIYMGLMEYYIGLEGLRFFLLAALIWREHNQSIKNRIGKAISWAVPGGLTAAGFLYWRAFLFTGSRTTTNLGFIFSQISKSLQLRGVWLIVYQIQDILNTVLFAWFVPFSNYVFRLRLKEFLPALGLGLLAALLVGLAFRYKILNNEEKEVQENQEYRRTNKEMLWIGILAVVFALIPAHVGDRHVVFSTYSRFSFPPSLGAVLFLVALFRINFQTKLRIGVPVVMVFLAVMTHYSNSVRFVSSWETMRSFWWQVSWRIPQLKPDTTLVVTYASQGVPEDYHIWGPANLIYYPTQETNPDELTHIVLTGSTLTLGDIQFIMTGAIQQSERRGFETETNYDNLLVVSNPAITSCVHVLDGRSPELSEFDRSELLLISSKSKVDTIQLKQSYHIPPQDIFGTEPEHDWCYFYQKASLAQQQKDWKEVISFEAQAAELGLRPNDAVEWLPFLEANAMTGNFEHMEELSNILRETRLTRINACNNYLLDERGIRSDNPEGYDRMVSSLCE